MGLDDGPETNLHVSQLLQPFQQPPDSNTTPTHLTPVASRCSTKSLPRSSDYLSIDRSANASFYNTLIHLRVATLFKPPDSQSTFLLPLSSSRLT
ncbi:hypothetical protein E4U59_000723 [Claviceps monticola]|nr:hypothetical protein E4U59_000723 [Claviceps monticola]